MKNNVLCLLISTTFFLAACVNKEETPKMEGEYFIKFKVNGEQREYTTDDRTPMIFFKESESTVNIASTIVLGPKNQVGSNNNSILLMLYNETPFQTGVDHEMQDLIQYDFFEGTRMSIFWVDEDNNSYNTSLAQKYAVGKEVKDDGKFRFTTITNDLVEGTFSGRLFGPSVEGVRGDVEKSITEGSFRLKVQNNMP